MGKRQRPRARVISHHILSRANTHTHCFVDWLIIDHRCAGIGFENAPKRTCQYNNGDRVANSGHVHIYVGTRGAGGSFETIGFSTGSLGTQSGSICDFILQDGYQIQQGNELVLLIEIEHNDHTRRTKFAPRDFPPIDVVTFKSETTKMCVK